MHFAHVHCDHLVFARSPTGLPVQPGVKPAAGNFQDLAIDFFFVKRQRENRLISLVIENPTMIGIGIDGAVVVDIR